MPLCPHKLTDALIHNLVKGKLCVALTISLSPWRERYTLVDLSISWSWAIHRSRLMQSGLDFTKLLESLSFTEPFLNPGLIRLRKEIG